MNDDHSDIMYIDPPPPPLAIIESSRPQKHIKFQKPKLRNIHLILKPELMRGY